MKTIIFILASLLIFGGTAWAINVTPTTTGYDVTYTEPTTSTLINGISVPLDDLDFCTVKFTSMDKFNQSLVDNGKVNQNASSASGGAVMVVPIVVNTPGGSEYNIDIWGTCTDNSPNANESAESSHVYREEDRLSPDAPQ